MKNTVIIGLVITGFAIICAGIILDGRAKAASRAHHAAMQRAAAAAAAHHAAVDEALAKQRFVIDLERERKLARIQAERDADALRQKLSEIWKGSSAKEAR